MKSFQKIGETVSMIAGKEGSKDESKMTSMHSSFWQTLYRKSNNAKIVGESISPPPLPASIIISYIDVIFLTAMKKKINIALENK